MPSSTKLDPSSYLLPTSAGLPAWLEKPIVPRLLSIPVDSHLSLSSAGGSRSSSIATATGEQSANGDQEQHKEDLSSSLTHMFSTSPHGRPNHALVNEYRPGQGILPHEDGPAYHPIVATVSLGSHTVLDIYAKNESSSSPALSVVDSHRHHHSSHKENAASTAGSDEVRRVHRPTWRILQEPRSLLISNGPLYERTLHGIADVKVDEGLDERGVANWGLLRPETREMLSRGGAEDGPGVWRRVETRVSVTLRDVKVVKDLGRFLPGFKK